MRSLLIVCLLILPLTTAFAQNKAEPFAVVELFASEGCSSCPPADDLLMKLTDEAISQNKRIYTLSFQVDYWNYLGWIDPFSQKDFTERQYRYAEVLRGSSVYTPQMIVNGQKAFVGSDEGQARQFIQEYLHKEPSYNLNIRLKGQDPQKIDLSYAFDQGIQGMVLNLALVEGPLENQVTAGENSGRLLKHSNIVRVFKTITLEQREGEVSLTKSQRNTATHLAVIAYLQDPHTMQILAAEKVDL